MNQSVPFRGRLAAHARTPLYRNAYSLLVSSASASLLGLVYWMLAARFYPAETVGRNATAISMMLFLSGVAQLNLMSAMIRFIPRAGRATGRLVRRAYALSLALSVVVGVVFMLGVREWAPSLGFLAGSPWMAGWFVLGVMAWTIFALQDTVLTGLRQTVYVPLENVAYALAKMALLVALAAPFAAVGILASWTVPLVAALVPVNLLIFRRLIPQHEQRSEARAEPLAAGAVARYVAGNYVGSLFLWGFKGLLPLVVMQAAGAAATAHFYLPFNIVIGLRVLLFNMGMSLTVEGAADARNFEQRSRRFLVHLARLVVPVILGIQIAAPYLLALSGREYAAEGATLLRLMALAVIPFGINSLYISTARVRGRVAGIALVQAAQCIGALAGSALLLPRYGLAAIGVALLLTESAVALALLLTALRPLLRVRPAPATVEAGEAG